MLIEDTSKFKIYKNSFEFIKDKETELKLVRDSFKRQIVGLNINPTSILQNLEEKFLNEISQFAYQAIEEIDAAELFDDEYFEMVGAELVEASSFELLECEDFDITFIKSEAVITGKILCSCTIEAFLYNGLWRIDNDPTHVLMGSRTVDFHLDVTYVLGETLESDNLEISKFRI